MLIQLQKYLVRIPCILSWSLALDLKFIVPRIMLTVPALLWLVLTWYWSILTHLHSNCLADPCSQWNIYTHNKQKAPRNHAPILCDILRFMISAVSLVTASRDHVWSTEIKIWICNHTHCFLWDVIYHPYSEFNGGLAKNGIYVLKLYLAEGYSQTSLMI